MIKFCTCGEQVTSTRTIVISKRTCVWALFRQFGMRICGQNKILALLVFRLDFRHLIPLRYSHPHLHPHCALFLLILCLQEPFAIYLCCYAVPHGHAEAGITSHQRALEGARSRVFLSCLPRTRWFNKTPRKLSSNVFSTCSTPIHSNKPSS